MLNILQRTERAMELKEVFESGVCTRRQVYEAAGMSKSHLSKLENGVAGVSDEKAFKICKALNWLITPPQLKRQRSPRKKKADAP